MNAKLTENPNIPVLTEWLSLTEAAKILGLSRQYVNKKAAAGAYSTLHRLGDSPSLVVSRKEIEELRDRRDNGTAERRGDEEAAPDEPEAAVTTAPESEGAVTGEPDPVLGVAEEVEEDDEDDFLRDLLK